MTSEHFELYTNAGMSTGREVLRRFEQVHGIFRSFARDRSGPPLPTRVFVFRSESEFSSYRVGESTVGYYQGGPERNYIVMRYAGPHTYRVAFHEYVHLVLNHSSARLPQWLEEGTAEFYSTLEASGSRLYVGRPIPEHVRTLAGRPWLDVQTLCSVTHGSPYYSDREKTRIFYAQSWALVHMLNLSPKYRAGMSQFAALLEEGVPAEPAFEKAFGKSLDEALEDLRAYAGAGAFPVAEVEAQHEQTARISEAQGLSQLESDLARAELLLRIGKEEAAEKTYRRLARRSPETVEAETGLGALALSRREYEKARRHLSRAIELGSRDGPTYFEYAMLLRESGASLTEVIDNLRKATALSPNFAEAHFVLGTLLSQENHHAEAVPHLKHAASILPRQAYFWHALALAHHHLGQTEEARKAAHRALHAASTEQQTEMAQAALRLIDERPPVPLEKHPEVTTPKSWQTKRGDSRVEGTLHQIDCLGPSARFYIRSGKRTIALYVENPGEILLRNVSSLTFEFRCGPQKPLPVVVEYIARPDPKLGTDGDVVAIEFR